MNRIRSQEHEAWARENPILEDGELGRDRTTKRLKIGDGSTRWLDLPYATDAPRKKEFIQALGAVGTGVWHTGQGSSPQFIKLASIIKQAGTGVFSNPFDGTSSSLVVNKKGLYACQALINCDVAGDVALVAGGGCRAGMAENQANNGYYQQSLPSPVAAGTKWRCAVSAFIEMDAGDSVDLVGIHQVTGGATSFNVSVSELHMYRIHPDISRTGT